MRSKSFTDPTPDEKVRPSCPLSGPVNRIAGRRALVAFLGPAVFLGWAGALSGAPRRENRVVPVGGRVCPSMARLADVSALRAGGVVSGPEPLDVLRLYRSGILDKAEVEGWLATEGPFRRAWGVEEAERLVDEGVADVYRAATGGTPRSAAAEVGVSEQLVRDWEDGRRPLHGTAGRRYAALPRPREAS